MEGVYYIRFGSVNLGYLKVNTDLNIWFVGFSGFLNTSNAWVRGKGVNRVVFVLTYSCSRVGGLV